MFKVGKQEKRLLFRESEPTEFPACAGRGKSAHIWTLSRCLYLRSEVFHFLLVPTWMLPICFKNIIPLPYGDWILREAIVEIDDQSESDYRNKK